MKRSKWITGVGMACVLVMSACSPVAAGKPADDKLTVTVSILPEQYFLERIGGEHVAVNVMVAPGDSPHTYEPKPEQMAALSHSAAYFSIGVEFEDAWLDKIAAANPNMQMVDLVANIERMPMDSHGGEEDADAHNGETLDPHVWTSPQLVKTMSLTIYESLAELDPQNKVEYKANLDGFYRRD